jgi:DNA repair exonuclease SbcCD nuclease subunit
MSVSIILGDVHLGKGVSIGKSGLGTSLNSRIVDQVNLLDWVTDRAIELNAGKIIVTGDVFEDPKPHPTLIKLFVSWLKRCEANDISVHILYGNHDFLRSGQFSASALDIIAEAEINNVFVYNSINTIHDDGISFTLVPFRDRRSFNVESHAEALTLLQEKLVFEAAEIPVESKKILIGHLTIEGSLYVGDELDDISNELFCPPSMFGAYDYTWMGHIHKPQVLSIEPYVAHVGSMDISDFGESDHDKVIIIVDSNLPQVFKEEVIPTRKLEKLSITIPKEEENPTQYVKDYISKVKIQKNSMVKVEVIFSTSEQPSIKRSEIEESLQQAGVFHVCGFNESKKISLIKKKTDAISGTIDESAAIRLYADLTIDEKSRDAFIALAEDVVRQQKAEDKS